jgi:hypothetical protein
MARIMEEQTARTFQSVALSLKGIAAAWRLSRPGRNDPAFRAVMRESLGELPYVRAIFVVGRDGRILHDTDYPMTSAVSVADREYFVVHRDVPGLERFVSVSQRLGDGERFEGIVVAALQPAYFEALYRRLELDREEGIAIARESLLEVHDVIQGVQVSAPFGNVKYALQCFDALPEFGSEKTVSRVEAL